MSSWTYEFHIFHLFLSSSHDFLLFLSSRWLPPLFSLTLSLCTVIIIIRHGIMRSLSIVLFKRNILSFITTFCHKKVHNFYLISFLLFFERNTIAFDRIIIFLNSFQCHIPTISLEHFILWTLISSLFSFYVSLLQLSLPLSNTFPRIYLMLCYVDCCTFM